MNHQNFDSNQVKSNQIESNLNRLRTKKKPKRASERSAKKVKTTAPNKSRQVILNSATSKSKSKQTSVRRKKIQRRSQMGQQTTTSVKKRRSRLKSDGESGFPGEFSRVKEKLRRIQVVPKDSLEITEFLENPSNIYKKIRGKMKKKGRTENGGEVDIYNRKRRRSKKKQSSSKISENKSRKKSSAKRKKQKKQIILNIANRKVAKIKGQISKKLQLRRAEDLFKTRKNYFSTNSRTTNADPLENAQSPQIFNLYNNVDFADLTRQPRDTKSTLKNSDPLESFQPKESSRKLLKRLMKNRENLSELEDLGANERKRKVEPRSLQMDSIGYQICGREKAQMESIAENKRRVTLSESEKGFKAKLGEMKRGKTGKGKNGKKGANGAEKNPQKSPQNGEIGAKNDGRGQLTKAKSKIFYKKLALIQFKFMNPENLRTKEFLKILKDLNEIKQMPTYRTDSEFRNEIRRMQILFAWHLLTRRLENLGKWKTNRAFSFLKIKQFSEVVGNAQKHKFRNKAIVQKMEEKEQEREKKVNFQESKKMNNFSFGVHSRTREIFKEEPELFKNAESAKLVHAKFVQKYFDSVISVNCKWRFAHFRANFAALET